MKEVEERIRRLMDGKLREKIDESLQDLEDEISQLEEGERRLEALYLVQRLRKLLLGEDDTDARSAIFERRLRYSGSSLIVTVPAKIVRRLGLEAGDMAVFRIRKKAE